MTEGLDKRFLINNRLIATENNKVFDIESDDSTKKQVANDDTVNNLDEIIVVYNPLDAESIVSATALYSCLKSNGAIVNIFSINMNIKQADIYYWVGIDHNRIRGMLQRQIDKAANNVSFVHDSQTVIKFQKRQSIGNYIIGFFESLKQRFEKSVAVELGCDDEDNYKSLIHYIAEYFRFNDEFLNIYGNICLKAKIFNTHHASIQSLVEVWENATNAEYYCQSNKFWEPSKTTSDSKAKYFKAVEIAKHSIQNGYTVLDLYGRSAIYSNIATSFLAVRLIRLSHTNIINMSAGNSGMVIYTNDSSPHKWANNINNAIAIPAI